jgi:hypothetical protein
VSGAKGRRAEWKSRDYLIACGYTVVRAAGSKGAFDLVAWKADGGMLVQVKSGRWPGRVERAKLLDTPCPPGFKRIVHRWDDRGRAPTALELTVAWLPFSGPVDPQARK